MAAYANSFQGVMLFDDYYILQNEALHDPIDWRAVLTSPRPVVEVSLAMNHAVGQLDPWGYHLVNVSIHVLAALVLFGLARRSLLSPALSGRFTPQAAAGLAFATALLWGLHPLQTQSVTYIIQRAESMMGLFYLLTLYCIARANQPEAQATGASWVARSSGTRNRQSGVKTPTGPLGRDAGGAEPRPSPRGRTHNKSEPHQREGLTVPPHRDEPEAQARATTGVASGPAVWYALAVAFCALGMLCKQVMVTAPIMALLYDRAFWSASWGEVLRRRWTLYVGLCATWMILLLTGVVHGVLGVTDEPSPTVGFGLPSITWQQYLMTQPGVVLYYLRLAIWPHPLCLDYAWPVVTQMSDAALPGAVMLALLACCVWAWHRRPALGFVGLGFFLVLAPTSSIIPIRDVIFEHRMYLPLAGVVVLFVLGGWELAGRIGRGASSKSSKAGVRFACVLLIGVATVFGVGTHLRNRDYHSAAAMWSGVLAIYPDHGRAHNNLGVALSDDELHEEALQHFARAIELEPSFAPAYERMANDLVKLGRTAEAEPYLRRSAQLMPNAWSAAYNHGNMLFGLERYDEAMDVLQGAKAIDPGELQPYIIIANILTSQDRLAEAIEELQTGLAASKPETPSDERAKARFNLANTYARLRRYDEAVGEYRRAIELNPGHYAARYGLGFALQQQGLIEPARAAYEAALAIQPDYEPARTALDRMQRRPGASGE